MRKRNVFRGHNFCNSDEDDHDDCDNDISDNDVDNRSNYNTGMKGT